jgi:hypothetical protein
MLALKVMLAVVAVATVTSLSIGFFGKTCFAYTKSGLRVFVVLIPVWVWAVQAMMIAALTVAIIWSFMPIAEFIGEGGGAILFIAPALVFAFQLYVLNRIIRWSAEMSVLDVLIKDVPVLKKVVETWTACV